jgi:hypothetical protein
MANIIDNKVYVVVCSFDCVEDFTNNEIDTKVFDSNEKAENYLIASYEGVVKKFEDRKNGVVMFDHENNGNNAMIEVGFAGGDIYGVHKWRVQMKTLNFEG